MRPCSLWHVNGEAIVKYMELHEYHDVEYPATELTFYL